MIPSTLPVERPSALSDYGRLWKSYYVRINGLRTRFITAGEGEPLVLLHGSAPGASAETNFHLNIAALARHFRVYGLDQVGYGRTEAPAGADVLGDEQRRVDHLLGFLDTLCLDRVHLMGQSMGSATAARFTCDRPDRVAKLVFVNLGGAQLGISATSAYRPTHEANVRALAESPNRETMRAVLRGLMHREESITDELLDARLEMALLPGALDAHRNRGLAVRRSDDLEQRNDLRHRLPRLSHPMLLLWGKQDKNMIIDVGYQVRDALPNLRGFHEFDDAGHHVQTDQFEAFNARVIEFLHSEQ
ncbi:MAG: alpha/beta fold hydrolase [Chloroflexota bacterium]